MSFNVQNICQIQNYYIKQSSDYIYINTHMYIHTLYIHMCVHAINEHLIF